jgi:hypothetical protein
MKRISWVLAALSVVSLVAGVVMVNPRIAYADPLPPEVLVKKTVETSYTRTYTWNIEKTADQSNLTLSLGQRFLVNYSVALGNGYTDGGWEAHGTIAARNASAYGVVIESVDDLVSPDIPADVSCPWSMPYDLPSGWTTPECSYSVSLPDGSARMNTATLTVLLPDGSYIYPYDTEPVTFGDPASVVDECADVYDTNVGFLGTVCGPSTFNYQMWLGPFDCGCYPVENTASFIAHDTGATGDASWTITVCVPCAGGCTLTPGYWKTHSAYGPAPYDDTWAIIGEDTPFFFSGKTYYEALWTSPRGNAYYILAHAYIAAELNQLNGADIPAEVLAAFDDATVLFQTYSPDDVRGGVRHQFIALAELLDAYNNGYIGPGHCSE